MKFKDQVIRIIASIPFGQVTTYGTIAALAGMPRGARIVGGILHKVGENSCWHRVVGKHGFILRATASKRRHKGLNDHWGFISTKCLDHPKQLQKALLEQEGIEVDKDFMINLQRYGWDGNG